MKVLFVAALFTAVVPAVAMADMIEGNWKTQGGETAAIAQCSSGYCITLMTGEHAGRRIGQLAGDDGSYSGTLTDPADDKTYSGSARIDGSTMSLKGCALKIFCRTQTWSRM